MIINAKSETWEVDLFSSKFQIQDAAAIHIVWFFFEYGGLKEKKNPEFNWNCNG